MVILTPVLSPHHLLGAAYELLKDHVRAYTTAYLCIDIFEAQTQGPP